MQNNYFQTKNHSQNLGTTLLASNNAISHQQPQQHCRHFHASEEVARKCSYPVYYYLVFDIVRTGADALNRVSLQQQRLLNWVDTVDFHTCFSQCRKSVKIVNRGQC